ncbi:MAG: GGDEF domain-containing protein [Methylomonas sp.]|uniref:GGDEF domain-containing protein n=1 Tax=Methylomonas sp. TaxID=418 RepID=UPI0025F0C929|nr:GGDEF domain-containing protein [Methylomonas sp.]MCK9608260.1 GGDEF domain-containing protein [Methylomonas sp.]
MQIESTVYKIIKWLDKFDSKTVLGLVFCLEFLIAWGDYITGPLAPFTAFFLLPIILSAFFLRNFWAYFFAVLSAIAVIPVISQLFGTFSLLPIMLGFLSRILVYLAFAFLGVKLRQLVNDLDRLASQDTLTAASRGAFFYEFSTAELARSFRSKSPLCLVFIDLDNFKEVNDKHGHQKGDQLLVEIAATIKANLREGDILGRLGGDEFAILLAQTSQEEAKTIMRRMQASLLRAISHFESRVTFSVGVVAYLADKPASIDELVALADAAMYAVKKTTKNAIHYVVA